MTRRERLERKLEKRLQWADGREKESDREFNAARRAVAGIEPGQPILVGHHSEKHHRRDLARHDSHMTRAFEAQYMAKHHRSKAGGLADQLGRTIFSDDDDAVEALENRIAEHEAKLEKMKQVNKQWKQSGNTGERPHTFEITNLRQRINADKKRITEVKRLQKLQEETEQAGGVLIKTGPNEWSGKDWATVRFAEKPPYEIIHALKDAGFRWGSGAWLGEADKLPECVKSL